MAVGSILNIRVVCANRRNPGWFLGSPRELSRDDFRQWHFQGCRMDPVRVLGFSLIVRMRTKN